MVSADQRTYGMPTLFVLEIRNDLQSDWLLDNVLDLTRYDLYCSVTAIFVSTSARLLGSASESTSFFVLTKIRMSSACARPCQIPAMICENLFPAPSAGIEIPWKRSLWPPISFGKA